MVLDGKIVRGVGAASNPNDPAALPQLLPIIAREYDELRDAYLGTINVRVREPIDLKIDFKTDRIIPAPPCVHRVEFVRVRFEFPLGKYTRAWIYQPYGWHWGVKNDKCLLEVLTVKIDEGVEPDKFCKIHRNDNELGSTSTSVHYLRWLQDQAL
jgi:hypothetical protein